MTVTATFAVELQDETSGAANAAASSLVKLKAKIDDDVKALREMQSAMRNLKGGTSTNVAAFRELRDRIAASKASIASAQSRFVELGGTFGKTAAQSVKLASAMGPAELGAALGQSGGAVATFGGMLSRLGPLLTNPIVLIGALVGSLLALAAAGGVALVSLLRLAVVESDARRSEQLRLEGLNTLRRAYGRTTASVNEYMSALDRASDSTNVSRSTLEGFTRSLARTGLHGAALTDSVEAMGMAMMVQGPRGASRFHALAIQARLAGRSVADVAAAYRNRLGPIARRIMLSLPNQTERFHRSLSKIFSGLNTDKFLGALDTVLSLFSQSTSTGRALKAIVESIFQPLIDSTEVLGPIVKRFFQGMVIGALLVTIAFLKVRNALRDAFGGSDLLANVDGLQVALVAGVATFFLFAAAVGLAAIALGGLVVAMGLFISGMLLIPAAIAAAGLAIGVALGAIVDWFSSTDFSALASGMIAGLVSGLVRGRDAIVAAVRGLASAASDTFRETLGIHSPSRVFADFGSNISGGVSEGIDAGRPSVGDSVSGLVDVPTGGGLGGATTISIGDVNVQAGGTSNPRELAVAFRDELASLLEGVSIEMGAT